MTTQSTPAIDRLLPDADVAAAHAIVITAPAAIVYQQAQALDLRRSWGVRQLFRLRGLPQSALTLEGLQRLRFALLVDDPPHEMVLGLVGRFWTPTGELRRTDPEDFRSFQERGFAKAAWNFSVTDHGTGQVTLRTETRVLCLDEASRRSFKRYWVVISPFSGWIRKEALRLIKIEAERCARARAASPLGYSSVDRRS